MQEAGEGAGVGEELGEVRGGEGLEEGEGGGAGEAVGEVVVSIFLKSRCQSQFWFLIPFLGDSMEFTHPSIPSIPPHFKIENHLPMLHHMTNIKQSGLSSNMFMRLRKSLVGISNRHTITRKRDHLCPCGYVKIMKRSFLEFYWGNSCW